jgi:hypothetical protein
MFARLREPPLMTAHAPTARWSRRPASFALLAGLTLGLAGCGTDGLELNGKIFDLIGVSDAAQKSNRSEPKLTERTGLVMPPDANRLPEPGSGGEPDIAAEVNDPDRKKVAVAAERARLHKAYCSGDITWKERALKKDGADNNVSPYGPCSVLGNIFKQ